ncbi:MAG: prolyl oligopeptidase family serine peptidase [Acidobacteriia bacterium]|nr:prolyl oligopeptidase family serine peptidase [Terriglobia bacterium]
MVRSLHTAGWVPITLCLTGLALAQDTKAPPTRVENFREVLHGVELVDPYHWLNDLQSPEVRAWIKAQNAYTHSVLDALPAREAIRRRLAELIVHDTVGAPEERGGHYFFSKRTAGQDQPVLYVRSGRHGKDEVLIDPRKLSDDPTTVALLYGISRDGKLVGYAVRQGGQDEVEIRFREVDSGRDLPDRLPKALYSESIEFSADARGFYYARRSRQTGSRVLYHRLGTDPARDAEIFGEGTTIDQFVSPMISEDGNTLLLEVQHGWAKTEIFMKDLKSSSPVKPLVTGIDANFELQWAGDRKLALMTAWKAPQRHVLLVDLDRPAPENWREVVPESSDSIESFSVVGGKLFVRYLHNVASVIKEFALDGRPLGEVKLPGLGSGSLSGRWNSPEGVLTFTSFVTPTSISLYDARDGSTALWFQAKVPIQTAQFETEQVWYTSKDGTRVPMFLVHKRGLKPDGHRPVLLYGYGGFNVSITPRFTPAAALWAEHDGVYALANIRGGGEFGEAWHRAGMLDKKQNVFDDFIAAAEWLIAHHYTDPARLAINGRSNGGLLMGAALTQRPDLYRAVLCEYPDLDMVRYYQFTQNNNPPALLEYGNAALAEQFKFLEAYSPYEHVKPGTPYPATLLATGDGDTRVPPQQACKMAAKLQAATTSGLPVLLRYDVGTGHAGGEPLSKTLDDMAAEYAFLFSELEVQ